MSEPLKPVKAAELDWRDGQPLSRRFADVYFSPAGGPEETGHVFIRGNRLEQRWRRPGQGGFTLAETGFGSGLNFLVAARLWLETAGAAGRCLHYCAVERHPLRAADLGRALARFPGLGAASGALLARYPPLLPGFHRLELFGGRVRLTLAFMDIDEWLSEVSLQADAWFLDGFAPARNPRMWSLSVLQVIGRNTAAGGTFATFTAAAAVRRGLTEAGFEVEKAPGFAGKREMLRGWQAAGGKGGEAREGSRQPWFAAPPVHWPGRRAAVVGAGLAGTLTACALARRGWQVTVFDRHEEPAQEASGHAAAVIFSRFSPFTGAEHAFYRHAYLNAVNRFFPQLPPGAGLWSPCGMLQLGFSDREAARQRRLVDAGLWPGEWLVPLTAKQAGERAGVNLRHGGLLFPQSGWAAPGRLCRHLLAAGAIDWRPGRAVDRLDYRPGERNWRLHDAGGRPLGEAEVVVIATAAEARHFPATAWLPLKSIRGQVSAVPASRASRALRTVLCYDGYLTPAVDGRHVLGATFDSRNTDPRACERDNRLNLERLAGVEPGLFEALAGAEGGRPRVADARAAFRCHTPDYLPVIGPVPDVAAYRRLYAALGKGQLRRHYPPAPLLPGLYVNVAHGARGLTTAPLAAEILAAALDNEPQPVPETLRRAVHPARFVVRWLQRREWPVD